MKCAVPVTFCNSLKFNSQITFLLHFNVVPVRRDSSVSIVTRLRAGWSVFNSWQGQEFPLPPPRPDRLWGPPAPMSTGVLSPAVKSPGHEVDHSPPPKAEVRKAWTCTPTPPYAFMSWDLITHRDNFTFTYTYPLRQWISTFVRPRPGKFFFYKTRARSQQIYS
jgi:hypothetical protein